jgi:hypothetical protein
VYSFANSLFLLPGDGTVGISEYRTDCVQRMAYKTIGELDASYHKLLNVRAITLLTFLLLNIRVLINNPASQQRDNKFIISTDNSHF